MRPVLLNVLVLTTAAAIAFPSSASAADLEKGKESYGRLCASCHGEQCHLPAGVRS